MAMQTKRSGLAAKYGAALDKAVRTHGDDETSYGIVNLPAGITNGVARLVEAKFDTYKTGDYTGEYYFLAAGVVLAPTSVKTKDGTMKVKGLRTQLSPMPMCATQGNKPKTQDENVARVLNEMRKLGVDTKGVGADDLEGLAAALKEAAPYFRFSTSPRKDPQTGEVTGSWENWNGVLEDFDPASLDDDDGVQVDETVDATEEQAPPPVRKPSPAAAPPKPAAKPAAKPTPKAPPPEPTLEELAAKADDEGDEGAQTELTNKAYELGMTEEDVVGAANWADLVEKIREVEGGGGDETAPETAEEPADPEKGDVFRYAPVDPKTKRPGKIQECEVTGVSAKNRTADLKNLTTKVVYKAVPWDALIRD